MLRFHWKSTKFELTPRQQLAPVVADTGEGWDQAEWQAWVVEVDWGAWEWGWACPAVTEWVAKAAWDTAARALAAWAAWAAMAAWEVGWVA